MKEHKFYKQNLYKMHINNIHNIVEGSPEGRFKLNFPKYFPTNKRCYVYVEKCQVQTADIPIRPATDFYSISSNLISPNSYTNEYKNPTGILCNVCRTKYNGVDTDNRYKFDNTATTPIYIGTLPSQLELFCVSPLEDVIIMNTLDFTLILCFQFINN